MRRLALILILFLASFFVCNTTAIPRDKEVKFKLVRTIAETKLPIVTLDINGKDFTFLVASGVSLCLIDSSACERLNLKIVDSKIPGQIVTFGGMSIKRKEVKLLNYPFYVQDMSNMVKGLEYHTGVRIDGLIGCNMLADEGAIINFQRELIYNDN